MLELILILGLFTNDNAEFFEADEVNAAAGLKWEYVGSQPVPEGHVAIASINPDTGKETIMFIRK